MGPAWVCSIVGEGSWVIRVISSDCIGVPGENLGWGQARAGTSLGVTLKPREGEGKEREKGSPTSFRGGWGWVQETQQVGLVGQQVKGVEDEGRGQRRGRAAGVWSLCLGYKTRRPTGV